MLVGVCGVAGILACSGDTKEPSAPGNPSQLYVGLQLNQHAINMAVHDTIRLTAAALTGGTPLSDAGPVHFSTLDSTVTVDSTGLMTARFATPLTVVYARVTTHGVTHTDSAAIQVTPTAPAPLAGFALRLPPGQDTNIAVNFSSATQLEFVLAPVLYYQATDAGGDSLPPLLVYYSSSDHSVAFLNSSGPGSESELINGQIYNGDVQLLAFKVGQVTISVETWAYGVAKRSSLTFVVGLPQYAKIQMLGETPVASLTQIGVFSPSSYIVGKGAVVTWEDDSVDVPIDVVFDDSSAVQSTIDIYSFAYIACQLQPSNYVCPTATGAGNILPFQADQNGPATRSRSFPAAGTYTYHSRLYGTSGTIIVR
jgi:hypothetical protein